MNASIQAARGLRKRWLWASVNVAGMVLYLRAGSGLWVAAGEEGTPGGPGDASYFFFYMLPILVAFLLLDLAALGWIAFRTPQPDRAAALTVWSTVVVLWVGVVAFDHHKSFREVDARCGRNAQAACLAAGPFHHGQPAPSA